MKGSILHETMKARTWKLRIDPAAEIAIVEEHASEAGTTK